MFLEDNFENWRHRMISTGFNFDLKKLWIIDGPIRRHVSGEESKEPMDKNKRQWEKQVFEQLSEDKVIEKLREIFHDQVCCLISNFKEDQGRF